MVVFISPNFLGGGGGQGDVVDVIWGPNNPQNWTNDNNKGMTPNTELYLGIQANLGKGKVSNLQYFQ